jgi:predicted xylose isomerase-like sugar epimerase
MASSSRNFEQSKLKKSSFKKLLNALEPLGGFRAAFGLSKGSSNSLASAADSKRQMKILPDTLDEHEMLETLQDASRSITTVGVTCSTDHSSADAIANSKVTMYN